jgi:hypothetical protein
MHRLDLRDRSAKPHDPAADARSAMATDVLAHFDHHLATTRLAEYSMGSR